MKFLSLGIIAKCWLLAFRRPELVLIGSNEMHILDPLWDTDEERNSGWAACNLGMQLSQNSGKQVGTSEFLPTRGECLDPDSDLQGWPSRRRGGTRNQGQGLFPAFLVRANRK